MKKSNGKRKEIFKSSWLKNPTLKNWIRSVPDKIDKAYCTYCKTTLYAHRYSIIKHATTLKHQENYEKIQLELNQRNTSVTMTTSVQNDQQNIENSSQIIDNNTNTNQKINRLIICVNDSIPSLTENINSDQKQEEKTKYSDIIYESNSIEENNEDKSSIMNIIDYDGDKDEVEDNWIENCPQHEEILVQSDQEIISKDMERKNITISTHILDTTVGQPASSIPVILYRFENDNWKEISRSATDLDGRCPALIAKEEFTAGRYKIHFNVGIHLKETSKKYLYPFIEIVFDCEQGQHYHIPLLLNPFGYSTYRGS